MNTILYIIVALIVLLLVRMNVVDYHFRKALRMIEKWPADVFLEWTLDEGDLMTRQFDLTRWTFNQTFPDVVEMQRKLDEKLDS